MSWLIDGHNLIPHIPGLSLKKIDDEMHLVDMLQAYSRIRRRDVEVYFDGAPAGQAGTRRFGTVRVHFIRMGKTADAAILSHLRQLGLSARNMTVVSSDRRVRAEAGAMRVGLISSEEFARDLMEASLGRGEETREEKPDLSSSEVEEWLKLFKTHPKNKK